MNTTTVTTSMNFVNITTLINGTYTFNATATDLVNNINRTLASRTVILATSPVVFSYVAPSESDGVNLSRGNVMVNVSITNTSTISRVEIKLFNSTRTEINSSNTTQEGSLFANYTGLSDGVYYFNVTGNDTSDNRFFLSTRSVTLDTTNPLISYGVGT